LIIEDNILSAIKNRIQNAIPGAKIFLFGSRAYGIPTEESDWDILVLTREPATAAMKKEIHTTLFPLSVQIGSFINTLIVQESDWLNNPSYYSLHQTIKGKMVAA